MAEETEKKVGFLAMAVEAVASYNERIKDLVLLAYAPERLRDLGLMRFVERRVTEP